VCGFAKKSLSLSPIGISSSAYPKFFGDTSFMIENFFPILVAKTLPDILVRLWRIIRASFSQERMTYFPEDSKVVYRSKDGKEEKIFDALEWITAMCSHPPALPIPRSWLQTFEGKKSYQAENSASSAMAGR
jgi:hypothetical protein